MIRLYNTLRRRKENFRALEKEVRLYTCGPTVYDYAHIGNLRTYIFEDILKRTLLFNKYKVKHVMNITDVGHLVSDNDTGEDKVEKSAKEKQKSAWKIAEYYANTFKKDIRELNIKEPDIYVKATETIEEQIDLIKILEKKKYTYKIEDGIYFNTSKLKNYGQMANLKNLKKGKRISAPEKKNPADFALWKFSKPTEKRQMEWDSPWGVGFPGWHTECVVMSKKYFGIPFDIHCGGIDHLEVHHPNEIAQAEAAYGKNPAKFWLHGEFLNLKNEKMSKSKGKIITLKDLKENGFSPLAYRYLTLTAHYRSKLNFSEKALLSAENSLKRMKEKMKELSSPEEEIKHPYNDKFKEAVNDDLNTPRALAIAWKVLRDKKIEKKIKYNLLLNFDHIFGLRLKEEEKTEVPREIKKLAKEREKERKKGNYQKADKIRKEIENAGYVIKDNKKGFKIKKI